MYGEAKSAMVKLNPEKNTIKIYSYKTIVDQVEDPDKEISLSEARLIKKSFKIGDIVQTEESTKDFGRIAAQTAKQVVMQKLKEMERQNALAELSEKEDELLTTIVKRIDNGTVYVQISNSHTEGVMLPNDQIPGEKFNVGDRVKVYTIGSYSKEICGGPHAKNTGDLGTFVITKEQSSSSGVRRIKAELR